MPKKFDSNKRMKELFADESFKEKLLELYKKGLVAEGKPCPACGLPLRRDTMMYMDVDFTLKFVPVVKCDCGFQSKASKNTEK